MMMVWFGFVLCALSAAGKVFITEVGKDVTLECGVESFQNRLSWYKESEMVEYVIINGVPSTGKGTSGIVSRSNIKKANLEISDVNETDAGEFRCEADKQSFTHRLVVVAVSVVPSGEVEVGSEATFQCQVSGVDQSITVKWQKPDGSDISERTHQLKPVATSDGGTWQCIVTHTEVTYKAGLNLTVKDYAMRFPQHNSEEDYEDDYEDESIPENKCLSCTLEKLLGPNFAVWIALGAFSVGAIFALFFVISMCQTDRKKESNTLDDPEDSTALSESPL